MKKYFLLFLTLLVLFLSVDIVHAEDQQNNQVDEQNGDGEQNNQNANDEDGNNQNDAGDNDAANEEAAEEDGADQDNNANNNEGDANADGDEAEKNENAGAQAEDEEAAEGQQDYNPNLQVCSDAIIQVLDATIYCDSPGTYYYGSGKYRNSETCMPGDKAKVHIKFYIADHDTIQRGGNYALVDVYADGGTYTQPVYVYENADMCSLDSLKKTGGSQCPYNGYFQINTQFYWGNANNREEVFQPTIHVGFRSHKNVDAYDYGGANTSLCRGVTFANWNYVAHGNILKLLMMFVKSFGILICTIFVMGMFIFVLSKKPRSFAEAKAHLKLMKRRRRFTPFSKTRELSVNDHEEFDFRKIENAKNQNLVDF